MTRLAVQVLAVAAVIPTTPGGFVRMPAVVSNRFLRRMFASRFRRVGR